MNKRLLLGLGTLLAFSIAPSAFAKKREDVSFRDSTLGVEVNHTCKGTKREIARCRERIRKRFVATVACAQRGGTYTKDPLSGSGDKWTCGKKVLSREEVCVQSGGVWGFAQSLPQAGGGTMNQKTCIKPEPSAQASSLPDSTDQGQVTGGSTSGVGY